MAIFADGVDNIASRTTHGFGYLLCAVGGLFVCARFAALWPRIKGRSARSVINTAADVATCVQHRLSRAALDSTDSVAAGRLFIYSLFFK